MALKNVGDPLGLTEYNHNLQLGYNKVDALGDKEVRQKITGGIPHLVTSDTTEKPVGLLAADIEDRLSVAGISRSILSNLWWDSDYDEGANPFLQSGLGVAGTPSTTTYDYAYSSAPRVVVTVRSSSAGAIYLNTPTTTSFGANGVNMAGAATSNGMSWVAIGNRA